MKQALAEIAQLKDRLEAENLYLHEELKDSHDFTEIVGTEPGLVAPVLASSNRWLRPTPAD